MASTMYARMATQTAYVVMYGIGDKAPSIAITAMMSEAMNHPFDGARRLYVRIRGPVLGSILFRKSPDVPKMIAFTYSTFVVRRCVCAATFIGLAVTQTAEEISSNEAPHFR